ncbi:MAG: rhodanese-like domain-containing protein [Deltaproteobacteria bacterium]|nr:rhodanese-like domain-containing protein [Deltaproteobacteria bacterium]
MNKVYGFMVLVAMVFWVGLVSEAVPSDASLTDQQKKEVVYKMYDDYKRDFPGVREISPKKAMKEMANGKIVFVDTRKPSEMAVSMLPGAISQAEFLKDPRKYGDKRIVAYCTISYRSGIFAREMAEKGIEIYNLRGGLLAWVLEGGKVYDAKGETKRINVYGKEWDYPPEGYESVYLGFFEKHF